MLVLISWLFLILLSWPLMMRQMKSNVLRQQSIFTSDTLKKPVISNNCFYYESYRLEWSSMCAEWNHDESIVFYHHLYFAYFPQVLEYLWKVQVKHIQQRGWKSGFVLETTSLNLGTLRWNEICKMKQWINALKTAVIRNGLLHFVVVAALRICRNTKICGNTISWYSDRSISDA